MFDWIRTIITDFMCLTNAITVYDLRRGAARWSWKRR